jgi:site-specific recombinase XerD
VNPRLGGNSGGNPGAGQGLLALPAGTCTLGNPARWLEVKKPTVATHTYIPYKRDCDTYLIPRVGGVKLARLAAVHVEKLYADLTRGGVSATMQRKAGTTLRVALQHAVHPMKLIPHNPAADVAKPRHKQDEMQVLDRRLAARRKRRKVLSLRRFPFVDRAGIEPAT